MDNRYDLYHNAICAIRRLRSLQGYSTRITFDCRDVFDEEGDWDDYEWFGWVGRPGSKYFIQGKGQTALALFQNLYGKIDEDYNKNAVVRKPRTLEDLDLSVRANGAIRTMYYLFNPDPIFKSIPIDWITDIGRAQFFKQPNVGKKTLRELEEELARYGLKLRDDTPATKGKKRRKT